MWFCFTLITGCTIHMVSILPNVFIPLLTLTRIASFPDSNPTHSVLHVASLGRDAPVHLQRPLVTVDSNSSDKLQYVLSSSGHGSRPEDIIASCGALQGHVLKVQEDAQKAIKKWED